MPRIDVNAVGVRPQFEDWMRTRGGVLVWTNLSMSSPDAGHMFTPATTSTKEDGKLHKPHWSYGKPELHTSLEDFRFVKEMREVKRFHVGIRLGSQGMAYKLTDGATRRVRKECDKAGPESTYHFDYDTQECVVCLPVWEEA